VAAPPAPKFTGTQKAAVVLLAMGDDATSEVFKHLSEREIEMLAREMSALGQVPISETEKVVAEFHTTAQAADSMIRGDEDVARRMLIKTLGTEAARKIIDRVQRSVISTAGFTGLSRVDPQQLSKFVLGEHPQTIALILAHMKASAAAELIASLPSELRVDVLTRMANLEEISPDVITRVSSVIEQRLKMLGGQSREQKGGVRAVASLFNHLERTISAPALESIEAEKPELALSIRNLMFVFEDLVRVDESGMREMVQQVDKKVLTVALKGASEDIRTKFFACMSKRAGEMMKEDMEAMGAVRLRDVEKAQQEIVAVARKLEEEGLIYTGEQAEEAYVQ
jgi:flagellar motor switch protein FliG